MCVYVCCSFSLFIVNGFVCLLLFTCLFSKEERKKAWSWMDGEVGRIWEDVGRRNHDRIYCMNFSKTNKEVGAGLMKN